MKNINLNDVSVFVEVVRSNGFRAAAKKLNLGAGSVSEAIQRMEGRLGVRLIERTTRKMSLTHAGDHLFQRTMPALLNLESALEDLDKEQDTLSGTLRLSAPRSSAAFFLDELIATFCDTYPEVEVEVLYDDSKVDLVTSGVDAAIRSQNLIQKESYAVEIGPKLDMALVSAPSYLKRFGTPKKPKDLMDYDGIRFCFGGPDRLAPWSFVEGKQTAYQITPKPRIIVNSLVSAINLAKAGLGLTYVYRKPAEPFIATGELVTLFDKWVPPLPRYTINFLTKRHMPARLRAFIDLAKKGAN